MRTLSTIAICLMLTGPVCGQETTTADGLRALIEDIRDWPPDFDGMGSGLAKAVKEQKSKKMKRLRQAGRIESVDFIESYRGVDLYYVRFRKQRWFVRLERDVDGKILQYRYYIVGW